MIINHKYNFIFQHNPKCAGTFLHHFLANYVEESYGERNLVEIFDDPDNVIAHITFDRIIDKSYGDYKLLMGVRDPVDLYISMYCDMNFPKEIMNYYKTSSKQGFRSLNYYDDEEASRKANKNFDFQFFMEKRTKGFNKEESVSYRFLEKPSCHDKLFVYRQENIKSDIKDFFNVNNIPFNKNVFDSTIIRMSNRQRALEIKSSMSDTLKNKIKEYEYTLLRYYK